MRFWSGASQICQRFDLHLRSPVSQLNMEVREVARGFNTVHVPCCIYVDPPTFEKWCMFMPLCYCNIKPNGARREIIFINFVFYVLRSRFFKRKCIASWLKNMCSWLWDHRLIAWRIWQEWWCLLAVGLRLASFAVLSGRAKHCKALGCSHKMPYSFSEVG